MNIRTLTIGAVVAGALAVAGCGVAYAASDDDADEPAEAFSFEVAENGTRFAFDEAPVFDDGMPGYGNPFVTEGYITKPAHSPTAVASTPTAARLIPMP